MVDLRGRIQLVMFTGGIVGINNSDKGLPNLYLRNYLNFPALENAFSFFQEFQRVSRTVQTLHSQGMVAISRHALITMLLIFGASFALYLLWFLFSLKLTWRGHSEGQKPMIYQKLLFACAKVLKVGIQE